MHWLALLIVLALAGTAPAAPPTIKDRAHLCSPDAVQHARDLIQGLRLDYRADVAIDTFRTVPFHKDPWHKVKKMSPAEQDRFVRDWARGRLPGPDSLYILIVQGPALRNVQVVAGRDLLRQGAITSDDLAALRAQLQEELNAGQADAGLLAALGSLRERLESHLGSAAPSPPFDWETTLCVVFFFLGVWLAVTFYQRFRGVGERGRVSAPSAGLNW